MQHKTVLSKICWNKQFSVAQQPYITVTYEMMYEKMGGNWYSVVKAASSAIDGVAA